jgi:hypothetical protein
MTSSGLAAAVHAVVIRIKVCGRNRRSERRVADNKGLTSYILGFRNTELAPQRFSELRRFFEYRVGSPDAI